MIMQQNCNCGWIISTRSYRIKVREENELAAGMNVQFVNPLLDLCYYLADDVETVTLIGLSEPFTTQDFLSLGELADDQADALIESRLLVFPRTIPKQLVSRLRPYRIQPSTLCSSTFFSYNSAQGVTLEDFEDALFWSRYYHRMLSVGRWRGVQFLPARFVFLPHFGLYQHSIKSCDAGYL